MRKKYPYSDLLFVCIITTVRTYIDGYARNHNAERLFTVGVDHNEFWTEAAENLGAEAFGVSNYHELVVVVSILANSLLFIKT